MGNILQSLKQTLLFKDSVVSSSTFSTAADIGACEGPFSLQLIWNNGASVNMSAILQVSNDKRNWDDYAGSGTTITTTYGTIMWDITTGSGCEYFRVAITVTGGSAEFWGLFNGKQRN
jgi:hypothetical protein